MSTPKYLCDNPACISNCVVEKRDVEIFGRGLVRGALVFSSGAPVLPQSANYFSWEKEINFCIYCRKAIQKYYEFVDPKNVL